MRQWNAKMLKREIYLLSGVRGFSSLALATGDIA